jgi:hypothetical protein
MSITDKDAVKFECGFQEIPCDYRGKGGVCEIEDEEGNAVCPAGE